VALFTVAASVPAVGLQTAIWRGAIASLVLCAFIDLIAATIHHVPFTQPYRPGHAKLKSRWPLYLIGQYVFVYGAIHLPMWSTASDPWAITTMVGVAALCYAAGRRAAHTWSTEAPPELWDDPWAVTILDIGPGTAARMP
jgi:hypothetical protein